MNHSKAVCENNLKVEGVEIDRFFKKVHDIGLKSPIAVTQAHFSPSPFVRKYAQGVFAIGFCCCFLLLF